MHGHGQQVDPQHVKPLLFRMGGHGSRAGPCLCIGWKPFGNTIHLKKGNLKVTLKDKSESQRFMLHFYVLSAILVTLGLVKKLLNSSTFSKLIYVSFKCCLFFYLFSTFLSIDTEWVCENQFGLKDTVSTLSNNKPFVCFSPAEEQVLKKDRYEELAGFWLCVGALLGTSRVALAVLRKLSYTQNLVKKMTDKGIPKKLLFWIYNPNPGPLPEKPIFCLMVCILVGNLIILYVLMKMLHLIS